MDLHYLEQGSGERTVILMHGWSGSSQSLKDLQELLASGGFHVFNLDLPGFGGTVLPPKAFKLDDYQATILKFIADKKITKPILIGHSFGGKIALKIAATHPDAISAVVAMGASGIEPKNSFKKKFLNKIAKTGKKLVDNKVLGLLSEPTRKLFYKMVVREKDYYKSGPLQDTFVNIVNEHLDNLLPKITIPVLLIWGEADAITPLWMGQRMAELIPGSELKTVAEARHNLPLVNPLIVTEIIYNKFKIN